MKIAFCCQHSYYGGLADNGGSQTIIHACNILNKLGHPTVIVTKFDKHTWIKHKPPSRHIPKDVDVCIACSVSDIDPMLSSMPKNAKAFWWCRLLETHQMSKDKIAKKAQRVKVIVNSEGLQSWFAGRGIKTNIIYQGHDHKWVDLGEHYKNNIGFLVSSKKRKHLEVVKKIVKSLGSDYKFHGFGSDLNRDIKHFLKKHFSYFVENARYRDVIRIYNSCDIWVSTSTSEGLHNCPMEAALCGCNVVYPDALLAGCSDHCNEDTAWRYKSLDVGSAVEVIKSVNNSRKYNHIDLIKSKINDRKINMIRLIELLKKEIHDGVTV